MRLLADMHIAPRTVEFLSAMGHDVVRVADLLAPSASDEQIIAAAISDDRVILTQDLDFTDLVALSGLRAPSVITLRLASSRVDHVNGVLAKALSEFEDDVADGVMVTVQDSAMRRRSLPIVPG